MTRCVAVAVAQHECSGGQCIRQGPWRAHECVHFMKCVYFIYLFA